MCGSCREGRWNYFGFRIFYGDFRRWPWKRRGEGDPRPWIWLAFYKFDFLFSPFTYWFGRSWSKQDWGFYLNIGPLEFNYLKDK